MEKDITILVVAGGKGERMNSRIPKQFIEIDGLPIIMHTLTKFYNFNSKFKLILVLPGNQISFWEELCQRHSFQIPHHVVAGGVNRFESVKNGLELVKQSSIVAVHDGVRPLVSHQTIARCLEATENFVAVVPVIDSVESIRKVQPSGNCAVDRNAFKLVQTPQVFDAELLKKAYMQPFSPLFTDDASVIESFGEKIHLVEGNRENIKITTDLDLIIAEIFLKFPA